MSPSKGPGLQIREHIGKLFSLFLTQNMFYVLGTQTNRLIAQPLSYLMLSALEKFQKCSRIY